MIAVHGEGVLLRVVVAPRAAKNSLRGLHNNRLKVALTAPPVDGEANEALILFFSKFFHCSKSAVEIIRGQQSKQKEVLLRGLSVAVVEQIVKEALTFG